MSKIFHLINDLNLCYSTKARYVEDFLKLNQRDQNQLCGDVRKALVDYVNSPEYSFLDILQNIYREVASKIIKIEKKIKIHKFYLYLFTNYLADELYLYNTKRDIELDNRGEKDFAKL